SVGPPLCSSPARASRDAHAFPTRRSSDLALAVLVVAFALRGRWAEMMLAFGAAVAFKLQAVFIAPFLLYMVLSRRISPRYYVLRSEEHTSELQSRENLVCRLLLEKKNSIG